MCLRVGVQVQNGLKRSRFEKLLVGFDGGQSHPVEREQQHQHDQPERQIKRHQPPRQRFEIAHAFGMIGSRRRAHRLCAGEELSHCSLPAAIPTPRAGPAQFAASKNRSAAELSQCSLPCCHFRHRARGLPRSRQGKTQRRPSSVITLSCCHFRHRARGLPRSRQGKTHRRPSSVIALSLLPFPAPRAGPAPFAARKNAATAEFSHCFRPAATSVAASRTTRAGWRPAETGSSRSRSPPLRRDSRRGSRADSSASPSDGWR